MSWPLLCLYGLGVTLGAGIYVLVGATAEKAGIFAPVSFLIAAAVVGVTALSYIELATRYPVSSGAAAYVEAGFQKPWLTTSIGLLIALSGIVSASAVAIGAGGYLNGLTGLPIPLLAIATVVVMGLLAAWGISESVRAAATITLIEVAGLLLVIGWSFAGPSASIIPAVALLPTFEIGHWFGIIAASTLAFFAFIGFEDMASVAEEVKDPRSAYPRAVIVTLAVSTLLYTLTTIAVVTTIPIEVLAGSSSPLMLAFGNAPSLVRDAFGAIAVVATVNGILIQIIMASRMIYGMADRGYLPQPLAAVSRRTQTPLVATATVVLIIIALSQLFPIGVLAERTSQIVLVTFILVNISLLRVKMHEDRPPQECFTVPQLVPAIGALACSLLLLSGVF
ncbi:MAG: amino acid permease [Erythrobacter sp.]|uniref:APC family permease n=1 Tax=Erythrobacter sp. TaxID=1042 RepID=UPI002622E9FB|nr:amino acid permease [Erythrobacter sp.]MDJ0977597.1 amino acid permease [Erythrobacter sp.]